VHRSELLEDKSERTNVAENKEKREAPTVHSVLQTATLTMTVPNVRDYKVRG
jgi:hypothetical protein